MNSPNRVINVRLTEEQAEAFDRLAREIPGLPKSVLLRLLLGHYLNKPVSEQIKIVTRMILKRDSAPAKETARNTKKRF